MKKKGKEIAYLGKDASFEGRLRFDDTFRIDGHFKGEITGSGMLIVGESGTVESDIIASSVTINGEMIGNITASERIEIHVPARVKGDIQAPSVIIDEGVLFEGNCRIRKPDKNLAVPDEHEISQGVIFGTVTDTDSGKPIADSVIKASSKGHGKKKTRTDVSGHYELTGLDDGIWDIENKARSYEKMRSTVEIRGGGRYECNFK